MNEILIKRLHIVKVELWMMQTRSTFITRLLIMMAAGALYFVHMSLALAFEDPQIFQLLHILISSLFFSKFLCRYIALLKFVDFLSQAINI